MPLFEFHLDIMLCDLVLKNVFVMYSSSSSNNAAKCRQHGHVQSNHWVEVVGGWNFLNEILQLIIELAWLLYEDVGLRSSVSLSFTHSFRLQFYHTRKRWFFFLKRADMKSSFPGVLQYPNVVSAVRCWSMLSFKCYSNHGPYFLASLAWFLHWISYLQLSCTLHLISFSKL